MCKKRTVSQCHVASGRALLRGWTSLCGSVYCKAGPLFASSVHQVPDQSVRRFNLPPFNLQESPFNPQFRLFPAKYFTSSPIPCYPSPCSPRHPSFRRIVPLFSAPSVPLRLVSFLPGVILPALSAAEGSVAKDLLFAFLLSASSASQRSALRTFPLSTRNFQRSTPHP